MVPLLVPVDCNNHRDYLLDKLALNTGHSPSSLRPALIVAGCSTRYSHSAPSLCHLACAPLPCVPACVHVGICWPAPPRGFPSLSDSNLNLTPRTCAIPLTGPSRHGPSSPRTSQMPTLIGEASAPRARCCGHLVRSHQLRRSAPAGLRAGREDRGPPPCRNWRACFNSFLFGSQGLCSQPIWSSAPSGPSGENEAPPPCPIGAPARPNSL